jgi:hypothetical protein
MINQNWYNNKNFNPANYAVNAVLLYLRAMFVFNKDLGFDVWEEESQDQPSNLSKLLICDKQTWDTPQRGHLPSVVLQRKTVTFGGGIQDGGQSRIKQAGMNLETSVMEIVTVPMVLSCIARNDLEAESLAFITGQFLWDDHRWMKAFRLFGMTSPQISETQIYMPTENSFKSDLITSFSVTKQYVTRKLPEQKANALAIYLNEQLNSEIKA